MTAKGHLGLKALPAGFLVHPEKYWLGASPDAWIVDPSLVCVNPNGIAEFKCPYSKRDHSPSDACKDPNFYCSMVRDGCIQLKRNHSYYHQVQLQLFAAHDKCHWCDFCIYVNGQVAVERIFPDLQWQSTICPQLDNYFFSHILPELVCPKFKPSYYL